MIILDNLYYWTKSYKDSTQYPSEDIDDYAESQQKYWNIRICIHLWMKLNITVWSELSLGIMSNEGWETSRLSE